MFSRVLKILILQDILRSGGTERQSIVLTKGLLANGVEAQLVTFRPGGALAGSARELPGGALQQPDRGWDWHTPGLAAKLREVQPDFVLAMGRMANCRLGWLSAGAAQKIATFRTGKPLPWLYRRALQSAAAVIANSAAAAETLSVRYGVSAEKIAVIYNGLVFPGRTGADPEADAGQNAGIVPLRKPADEVGPPNGLRENADATPRTTVFLCVAMLRPEKRQRELLEILAELPAPRDSWQLWLAGDGPARPDLERRVHELGLKDRVKFLGFTSDPSAVYAAADIAVHASESEALSNFLIEAQAHGLPAVAYDAQGIAECMIAERTGWIIPRGDRTAFRAALGRLMGRSEAEKRAQHAEAAAFARERFDADRQIRAYVTLLRRLQSGASS